jgi:uncharacterized protein (TIGR03067 family)
MQRLILAVYGVILGAGLVLAGALPAGAQTAMQGNWAATKAETNGAASPEVVGNRLSVSGNRFEIKSKDGKSLFAGTVRIDPKARPAAVDFAHSFGALNGKTWKGIYKFDGDTLTICDNAAIWRSPGPPHSKPKAGRATCSSRSRRQSSGEGAAGAEKPVGRISEA